MNTFFKRYDVRLIGVFLISLVVYLAIAYFFHAPRGYYGTIEIPRFADPWLARGETILSGGLIYRDVFTTTPPITNYLLLPPVIVSQWFGHVNPWATLSFMLYFSLFNLFAAFVLLYMADDRRQGYLAALFFLLNPLTFGNTILRRQDESVIVFFIALSLLFLLRRRDYAGAISIRLAMCVKLTGAVIWPIAILHTFKWQYFILTPLVFLLILSPFLALAGEDAMFWNVNQEHAEHPFQFGGVSLGSLWNRFHEEAQQIPVQWPSWLFVIGMGITAVFITWKRFGVLEDLTILIAMTLILSPKLHTGYFSMLALTMAPLVRPYRFAPLYFLFGFLAIVADFYKWPIENFPVAFVLMVIVLVMIFAIVVRITRPPEPVTSS